MVIQKINDLRKWLRQFPLLRKFIKFGFVGTFSALVSLAVHWIITLEYPAFNLPAKAIGWIMGFFVGFTLNKLWTYVEQTDEEEKYLLKYISVYAVTFFFYLIINYVLDHHLGKDPLINIGLKAESLNNIIAIVINSALNFLGTNYMVFKVPEPKEIFKD